MVSHSVSWTCASSRSSAASTFPISPLDVGHPVAVIVVADDLVLDLVVGEQLRRVLGERFLGVGDVVVLLVLDLDGVGCGRNRGRVLGRDRRDRIADVADVLVEHVHVPRARFGVRLAGARVLRVRHVVRPRSEDGVDAVQFFGLGRVDGRHAAVWNLAADDRGVSEIRKPFLVVRGVLWPGR